MSIMKKWVVAYWSELHRTEKIIDAESKADARRKFKEQNGNAIKIIQICESNEPVTINNDSIIRILSAIGATNITIDGESVNPDIDTNKDNAKKSQTGNATEKTTGDGIQRRAQRVKGGKPAEIKNN